MSDQYPRVVCRGVNCQLKEGVPGGEVTFLTADPNRTRNPVTRHPPPSTAPHPAGLTWLERLHPEGCSPAVSQLTKVSVSRNPGRRGFSDVSGGSALNPDASGPLPGGHLR